MDVGAFWHVASQAASFRNRRLAVCGTVSLALQGRNILHNNAAYANSLRKNLMRIYVKFGFGIIFALFSATLCLAQQPNGNDDVLKPVTVKTDLYPANADANKEIEEALNVAASTNKRVMLVFGGNWCYDCHVLDQALHEGDAGTIVKDHFLLVHVDIGEANKNLDLVKKYETTLDFGVPTVVLLNGSGRVIYSSTKGEFEPARRMMKKDLVAFLNEWKSTVIVRP